MMFSIFRLKIQEYYRTHWQYNAYTLTWVYKCKSDQGILFQAYQIPNDKSFQHHDPINANDYKQTIH